MKAIQVVAGPRQILVAGHPSAVGYQLTVNYEIDNPEHLSVTVHAYLDVDADSKEDFVYWGPETLSASESTSISIAQVAERNGSEWKKGTHKLRVHGQVEILKCSFCGKDQSEIENIVAGIAGKICNECIEHAHEIVNS